MAHRIPTIQSSITRYKKRVVDTHLPEATRLLGIDLVDADRVRLRNDLSLIKKHLQNAETQIREALEKWDNEISRFDDEAIRNEKSNEFLQYRVNGTEESPGNVDELVEDTEEQILDIDQRIDQIMNPVVAPPLPVPVVVRRDPVPAPATPGQVPVPQQAEADKDEISGSGAETNRNVTGVDRSNVKSPPVELDGPSVRRSTPSSFPRPFANSSERRTWESFSYTGRIPITNLKTYKKNPENSITFISHVRVLPEKVKRKKRNPSHAIRICVVNPVRWKRSSFKNRKARKSWTPSSRHKKSQSRPPWNRKSSRSRSPIQRLSVKNPKDHWKSWNLSFRQCNSSSISELSRPHDMTKFKKGNLDPGIWTQNGHNHSLFAPECRGCWQTTRKKLRYEMHFVC